MAAPSILQPAQFADGLVGQQVFQADAPGATAVEFQIDGETIATDPGAPFEARFNADDYAAGQHVLRARARDANQDFTAWRIVTVRVGGGRDVQSGFTKDESFVTGLGGDATAIAQAPDGRLFVTTQGGALRIVKNGALLPTPFLTLNVDASGERGLLGVALHPNFAVNGWVFVYYTTRRCAHPQPHQPLHRKLRHRGGGQRIRAARPARLVERHQPQRRRACTSAPTASSTWA